MEPARQQFDLMLREAAGSIAERCVHLVVRQRVPGLRDVVELPPEPSGSAFVAPCTLRVGPP